MQWLNSSLNVLIEIRNQTPDEELHEHVIGHGRIRTNVDGGLLLGVIRTINDDAELILMEL